MKMFVVFAAILALGIAPIYASADSGGPPSPGGDPALNLLYANATIVPWDPNHPIEAALGVASITINSTAHNVGVTGANPGQHFWLHYAGSFDVNGTIDTTSYDQGDPTITCDGFGSWSHTFPSSSGILTLPIGTYTATVRSSVSDNLGILASKTVTASAGFTIQ